jgi:hypothetical protein
MDVGFFRTSCQPLQGQRSATGIPVAALRQISESVDVTGRVPLGAQPHSGSQVRSIVETWRMKRQSVVVGICPPLMMVAQVPGAGSVTVVEVDVDELNVIEVVELVDVDPKMIVAGSEAALAGAHVSVLTSPESVPVSEPDACAASVFPTRSMRSAISVVAHEETG